MIRSDRTPARRSPLVWLLVTLLAACGGGGAEPAPSGPISIVLGTLSSVAPSVLARSFLSPIGSPATVSVVGESGPFSIEPGAAPTDVDGGGAVSLPVVFSPPAEGPAQGSIELQFVDGGETRTQTYNFSAVAEPVTWSLEPFPVGFGIVTPNTTEERDITVRNTSVVNVLDLTTATLPSARFGIVASPFPLTLAPGQPVTFTLQYTPIDASDDSGVLLLDGNDPGGPLTIPVLAGTDGPGSEVITDFGSQMLSPTGFTDQLVVNVPSDAISLTLEGTGDEDDELGLGELIGPNGRVFENTQLTGNYIWVPAKHAFATTVPNTDQANVQLDGPGDYLFRITKLEGSSTEIQVRAIVERRAPGFETVAVLPLNIWLADGLPVDSASAPTDTTLQNTLVRIGSLLGQQGIQLGDIDYYDVTDPDFDRVTNDVEFGELLKLSATAAEERLNLFFVQTALGGNTVGVSATIDGPKKRGTVMSGVMSIYSSDSDFVGFVAAHEIGHFGGLFHTAEQDGTHDFIDDTLECPGNGSTNEICSSPGGAYLMHWQALGGINLSNSQGRVLRGHALMAPVPVDLSKFRPASAPPTLDAATRQKLRALGSGWCGTCRGLVRLKEGR